MIEKEKKPNPSNFVLMWDDLRGFRDKTDNDFREIRGNFYKVWGGIITCTLGLAWLMAKGFHWL